MVDGGDEVDIIITDSPLMNNIKLRYQDLLGDYMNANSRA